MKRRTSIVGPTLAAAAWLITALPAQCYYNPSAGRWISRDPAGEPGGANLYANAKNDPVQHVDRLGLAFYAIDGTWTTPADESNPWWLTRETKETPTRYWRGPRRGATGSDTLPLAYEVANAICEDWCEAKDNHKDLTINLTGWSRGAMAVAMVAETLNIQGCRCGGWLCFGGTWHRPIRVNWIGVFDAVAQMGDQEVLWPRNVPSNVSRFDHAVKTAQQSMFPTWHFTGENQKSFTNKDGSATTHRDIGESHHLQDKNDAYTWIKSQARAAGVSF